MKILLVVIGLTFLISCSNGRNAGFNGIHSSEIGTKVEVGKLDGHQKRISATIVNFPFYDPDKSRVKS